jgi:hypothetical protein
LRTPADGTIVGGPKGSSAHSVSGQLEPKYTALGGGGRVEKQIVGAIGCVIGCTDWLSRKFFMVGTNQVWERLVVVPLG